MNIGYARVSTREQNVALQVDALKGSMPFPVEIDRSTNMTIGGSIPLLCSSTQT